MAGYSDIYYSSYYSIYNRKTDVFIKKLNYTGSSTEITLCQDPLYVRMIEDDDIEQPIKGTEATLNIFSATKNQYSDLYMHKEKTYQLFIYHGLSTSEILQNRWFHGDLGNWTALNFLASGYNSAKMLYTSSDGTLTQTCNFPSTGTYVVSYYFRNALSVAQGETLKTYYDGVLIEEYEITDTEGSHSVNLLITTGNLQKEFKVVKSWIASADYSRLELTEISILPYGIQEHSYDLFFNGYIQPRSITEPYNADTYNFQVRATCGLGEIASFDYKEASDTYYHGSATLLSVIKDCLLKSKIALPIKTKIPLWHWNLSADGSDPLAEFYCNRERFRYKDQDNDEGVMNCQEVISEILKVFGARIYQTNGFWHIERLNEKPGFLNHEGSPNQYVYNQYGEFLKTISSVDDNWSITDDTASSSLQAIFTNGAEYLSTFETYKNIELNQDYGRRNSIVYGDFDRNFWATVNTLKFWTEGGGVAGLYKRNGKWLQWQSLGGSYVLDDYLEYNSGEWSKIISKTDLPNNTKSAIKVTFNCNYMRDYPVTPPPVDGAIFTFQIWLSNYYTGLKYYLKDDGSWEVDQTPSANAIIEYDFDDGTSFTLESNEMPFYLGYINVRMFRARKKFPSITYYGKAEISNFRIVKNTFGDEDTYPLQFHNNTNVTLDSDNFNTKTLDLILGDFEINRTTPSDYYLLNQRNGGIFNQRQMKLTYQRWGLWDEQATGDLIRKYLKDLYYQQYRRPRLTLTGDIIGYLDFTKVINETVLSLDRKFIFTGGEYNDYYQQLSGSWTELGYWTPVTDYSGSGDFDNEDFSESDYNTDTSNEE